MSRELFTEANRRFWDALEARPQPRVNLVSFDPVETLSGNYSMPWMTVPDDLNEVINLTNHWGMLLLSWSVWAEILPGFPDENDRGTLRFQLIDPIAFSCMFQPSAMRDRLAFVATHAIHQGNQLTVAGSRDWLPEDDLEPHRFFNRRQKEAQLRDVGRAWLRFPDFFNLLRGLDSRDYRHLTRDFRNRASHAIAPRFESGHTRFVTRSVGPASRSVQQSDETFEIVEDPTRRAVSYGFGGAPPLRYADLIPASQAEHGRAVATLDALVLLLGEIVERIDARPARP